MASLCQIVREFSPITETEALQRQTDKKKKKKKKKKRGKHVAAIIGSVGVTRPLIENTHQHLLVDLGGFVLLAVTHVVVCLGAED